MTQQTGSGDQSSHHKWLAFSEELKCDELETLPAGTMPRTSHHRSPGGENGGHRKPSTIFRERMWESKSHEHSDCFKGNVGETSERPCEAHNYGLSRTCRYHLKLNLTVYT